MKRAVMQNENFYSANSEKNHVSNLWKQEYSHKGIPSSFRTTPSAAVRDFTLDYLSQEGKEKGPGKVLDLGCGLGRNSFFFAEKGFEVSSLDVVPENIEYIQQYAQKHGLNITAICGDVTERLPAEDNSIDIIIDIFCYKHQTDDNKREFYRSEICRVLKDTGYYFLSLAGKNDGYYGPLMQNDATSKIVDPKTNVGSVLFNPEDIQREFKDYHIKNVQTVEREDLMHGENYLRVIHNFAMQKNLTKSQESNQENTKATMK